MNTWTISLIIQVFVRTPTGLDVVDGLLIRFCAIVWLFLKATKENGYVRTCDGRN